MNIGSALVGMSFTVAVWPLLIVFKAGRAKSNLGKYSYVLKFIGEIQIAVRGPCTSRDRARGTDE